MQDYGIEVRESRGRLSYLTPDRTKPVTARKLGTDYDKAAVLSVLAENASRAAKKEQAGQNHRESVIERLKHRKTSGTAPNQDSIQRMVDIPAKMGEGKGKGYEWWAKGFNLQQMSQTMIYLEECGFSCPEDVDHVIQESSDRQRALSKEIKSMEKKIADNKELIRQASVYRKTKPSYEGLKKARKRERYEEENRADLALFAAAGRYFQERGMTKFPDLAKIKAENQSLVSRKNAIYSEYLEQKTKTAELRRVKTNLDAMLRQEYKPQRRQEQER